MSERQDPNHQPDKLEDTLQDFYQIPAPPAEFVERLEQQLRARHPHLVQQQLETSAWSRFNPFRSLPMLKQHTRPFVSGVVGLALLFALIVGVMALFSSVSHPTAFSGTPTPIGPQLRLQGNLRGSNDPFGSSSIPVSIRAPQPHFPDQVPLYDVQLGFERPSVEVARRWAEQLGLKSVRVYQDGAEPNQTYIAQGEDGRVIRLGPEGMVSYEFQLGDLPIGSGDKMLFDQTAAQAAAQSFLKSIPDLIVLDGGWQAQIEIRVEPQQADWTKGAGMTFQYVPVIDGIPVRSSGMPGQVFVGRDGQVRYATFMPLRIKPAGKTVALRPIETVLQEFVNDDPTVIRHSGWGFSPAGTLDTSQQQQFYRESTLAVGDEIETQGYVQHWVAADGGRDQFIMLTMSLQTFVLEAEGLDLAQSTAQRDASITGRLIEQIRPDLWRVQVSAVEPLSDTADRSESLGVVRRQPDGVWLEIADGQKYLLPDAPAELTDGTHVYAPGIFVKSADQTTRLEWQIMTRVDEALQPDSGVSTVMGPVSVSQSGGVAQAVPVEGPSGITPTLPAWWTYQPGDEVTLEGELWMQGVRYHSTQNPDQSATASPEKLFFDANLLMKSAQDQPADQLIVVLTGDAVNLDLLKLNGLSLRVQGRVLTAEEVEARLPGRGVVADVMPMIEITHYEKAYPAEAKAIFSGEVRVVTIDNQRVGIISDTLSQREYVLGEAMTYSRTLPIYPNEFPNKAILNMIGITAPDRTYGGYPIVRVMETNMTGNSADAVQQLRKHLENPIEEIGPESRGPADVVIDRVELAYSFQWQPARERGQEGSPVIDVIYHLTGHSSDNRYTLTYDLGATTDPQP